MDDTNLQGDEILYKANPSMWRNHPLLFFFFICLIPVFGVGVLLLLAWYVKTRAELLIIRTKKIEYRKGILSKRYVESLIEQIRTVTVDQSFWQRIFKAGSLEIYTAGDIAEIEINGLPHPNRIREIIKNQQESIESGRIR